MANFYSDQMTNIRTGSPANWLKPADLKGRIRAAYFSYTTPGAGAPAVADFIALVPVPAGARVLRVSAVWEAMSSGAGTAGADFGPADDDSGLNFVNDYVAALNMDAAGNQHFVCVLDKLPNATPYAVAKVVCAKVTGEAWAVSKKLQGIVEYVQDA